MNMDCIEKTLEKVLSKERFYHTIGVRDCAVELAQRYGLDIKKAELAGLLHDCAKCMTQEELRCFIEKNCPNVDENELKNYKTLHAPVGEKLAFEKFEINDPEILSAIRWHTLGKVNMTTFEKIIFLADKIEKNTRDKKYREEIIKILDENEGEFGLDLALFRCFKETIKSLVERELYICNATIDVYNWLLELTKK